MWRLLLVLQLGGGGDHPHGDSWLGADKLKHFFVAGFVQSMSYSATRATGASYRTSLAVASGVTATISIGKEWHDARSGGVASVQDLTWDAAGAVAASAAMRQTVH